MIHAYARIATADKSLTFHSVEILIHACAKIATGASAGLWSSFLIHACAKIATQKAREWEEWAAF